MTLGPRATEPLCHALANSPPRANAATIEWLGRVADGRAIPLLVRRMEAHQQSSAAFRACIHVGLVVWGVIALAMFLSILVRDTSNAVTVPQFLSVLGPYIAAPACMFIWLRRERRLAAPILTAIGRIAARHPAPEDVMLARELSAIARTTLFQPEVTRRAARDAASAIAASAGSLVGLPVPASRPESLPQALPVPAGVALGEEPGVPRGDMPV